MCSGEGNDAGKGVGGVLWQAYKDLGQGCCGGEKAEGGSRGGDTWTGADPSSLVSSDRMCGNGSALHRGGLGRSLGGIFSGWSDSGTNSLEGWSIPQGCQCFRACGQCFNLLYLGQAVQWSLHFQLEQSILFCYFYARSWKRDNEFNN